ncbi:MAG: hypothetical protein LBE21_07435 [Pseudomonadales bacterium]|jgi:hypothetical protein|nr:hypothetical protein [Pseudomonadales bacterium]
MKWLLALYVFVVTLVLTVLLSYGFGITDYIAHLDGNIWNIAWSLVIVMISGYMAYWFLKIQLSKGVIAWVAIIITIVIFLSLLFIYGIALTAMPH